MDEKDLEQLAHEARRRAEEEVADMQQAIEDSDTEINTQQKMVSESKINEHLKT